MNMDIKISVQALTFSSFEFMSNSEIAGDMVNLCLLYLGTAILVFFF